MTERVNKTRMCVKVMYCEIQNIFFIFNVCVEILNLLQYGTI